jgi:hypothetical protein
MKLGVVKRHTAEARHTVADRLAYLAGRRATAQATIEAKQPFGPISAPASNSNARNVK